MAIITISEKCTGCASCVKTCPQKILKIDDNKKMYVADPDRCMSCYGCEDECKFGAVYNLKGLHPTMTEKDIKVEKHEKIESEYDVVIIGAGPSGLGTAIRCAEEGLKTAVFERLPNREVSHHNCGGVLFCYPGVASIKKTDGFLEIPEYDFKLNDDFIYSNMEWLSIEGPGGYRFGDKFKKDLVGYICDKDKLVHQLVDIAEEKGAHLFYNTRVIDVLREDDKITGLKILNGPDVLSKVVVTADGILGNFSTKTKIPLNKETLSYIQYLTLYYERPDDLTTGFSYVMGELDLDDDVPPSVGCVGVAEYVEISLIMYSPKKFYIPKKPIDHYVKKILNNDDRIKKYLGKHADSLKLVNIRGTRLRSREVCRDIAVNGAVAVGDNWISGAQLGNINSIVNGFFTANKIKDAFKNNDFSKDSLLKATEYVNKDVEMFIDKIGDMSKYPTDMDAETLLDYFWIFHKINYPTLFFGSKKRIIRMMMGIMLKSIFKLIAKPRMFKYMS
ncbi:FAD-dependent oxidoreductase [Bacteroidota bacterium]